MRLDRWIGLTALITGLAAPVNLSCAQSAVNLPAPVGCVWRVASVAFGGETHLRCQRADGSWSQVAIPRFDQNTVEAAQHGDPSAMTALGMFYQIYAPPNLLSPALAMEWLRKAAAAGDGLAMTQLGLMYEAGDGVAMDDAAAARWLLAGANAGSWKAMFFVAVMYERGVGGLPKDEVLARHWALEGAQRGDDAAMTLLSVMYRDGIGGPTDIAEADRWQEREHASLQARCVAVLGRACDLPSDPAEASAAASRAAADAMSAAADAERIAAEAAKHAPRCTTTKDGC